MKSGEQLKTSYDAVIVGARVAGASTAMLLARGGQRVLVLDKSVAGGDTTSTLALMRAGIMQLHRWGILERVIETGTPAIRRTTFHYGDDAIGIDIRERNGVDALYAPRRTKLDVVLAHAARDAGAQLVYGATVERVLTADGRVTGVEFRDITGTLRRVNATVVIGADGLNSLVARAVNAGAQREGAHFTSTIYGFWRGLDLDGTHWYYGHDVAAGAIPTHDGLACVFAAMRPERYESRRHTGLDTLFTSVAGKSNPDLAHRLARGQRVGKLHPFAGRTGFVRRAWGPGWALVGDAGCFKDPLTAHGMTDALRDAEFLSRAILGNTDDTLASYQTERDAFAMEFLELSDQVSSFDWDFEQVKVLHHRLSKLMGRECDRLDGLDQNYNAPSSR